MTSQEFEIESKRIRDSYNKDGIFDEEFIKRSIESILEEPKDQSKFITKENLVSYDLLMKKLSRK
ncbi:MAG: hypothetical protein SFY32_00910 [Bacteroidota bacterium]|nr:hypothetical protein [Bacteroidota bacterium]